MQQGLLPRNPLGAAARVAEKMAGNLLGFVKGKGREYGINRKRKFAEKVLYYEQVYANAKKYYDLNLYGLALKHFRKSYRTLRKLGKQRKSDVLCQVGLCCLSQKNEKEGIRYLDKAIRANPANANALDAKGMHHLGRCNAVTDWEEAQRSYVDSLGFKEGMKKYKSELKGANTNDYNINEAQRCFELLAKLEPKDKHIWYCLGLTYYLKQLTEEAIFCFDRVLRYDIAFEPLATLTIFEKLRSLKKAERADDEL